MKVGYPSNIFQDLVTRNGVSNIISHCTKNEVFCAVSAWNLSHKCILKLSFTSHFRMIVCITAKYFGENKRNQEIKLRNQPKIDMAGEIDICFCVFAGRQVRVGWVPVFGHMQFFNFPNVFLFPKISGAYYVKFLVLDVKFHFTCGKWSLVKSQNFMSRIVGVFETL